MAYDSVRAQLDKLLGPDRNGPLTAASTTPTDYHHPEICKNYLLGFCPNDLHIKHRSEPGSCRRRHSDGAKAAFEKDIASFKASREKARWTASLLSECRAIVMDEDRKIRCHARRLKETYNAQGDLAGLMIQSFDTLKKLGMVSKDAKIRVLSEMDHEEYVPGPASNEAINREEQTALDSIARVDVSKSTALPLDGDGQRRSPEEAGQDRLTTYQSNLISSNEVGSESDGVKEDDAEDDDDFGLIKVIPAVNKTGQETDKPESTLPTDRVQAAVQAHSSSHSSAATTPDDLKLMSKANEPNTEIVIATDAGDRFGRSPKISSDKVTEPESVQQSAEVASANNREVSNGYADGAFKDQPAANCKTEPDDVLERSHCAKTSARDPPDIASKSEKGQGQIEPVPSMDEFYERGMGPDGLLMLDRKQSLRVCACCGGYISLVDAESRLLSHYGGKSHHSLAQLRKKVVELEVQSSAEPVSTNGPSRPHFRDRSEERERDWPHRGNERRHTADRYGNVSERYYDKHGGRSGGRFEDRRRERSRRDSRGFGTAQWYNNFAHDNIGGPSSRRGDERSNFDGSQSQRYSKGRKRYRSRSPIREFRRPRRHY